MSVPIEALYCLAYHLLYEISVEEKQQIEQASQKFVYYFAYGSIMNQQRLEEKIGRVRFVSKASLYGFQLNFASPSSSCSVRATLVPNYQSFVEGAVYKITQVQLFRLDKAKGNDDVSQRLRVLVKKDDFSPPIPVELHVMKHPRGTFFQAPTKLYLLKMIQGAEQIEVSEKYLKILKQYAFSASPLSHSKL
jgi:gamma-glutamylcyclotransferase (GGCT)/AIG2-like uncharacterized protein YtfP